MSQPPETRASAVDVDGGTPETNTDDGTPETISNDGTPQTPPLPPTKQPHLQPVRQRHSHSVGGNRLSAASSLQHAHQSPIAVTTPRLIQHMEEYALVEVNQLTKIVVYPGGDEDPGGHGGDRASWNKAEILSPQAARASASGGNSGSRENVSSFQRRTGLTSEQATR